MYSEQSFPIYQKRRVKRKRNKRLVGLIILFFLFIAIIIYLKSPISRIAEIEISGIDLLSENDIYKTADLRIGMYYLPIRTNSIKRKLLELEEVKEVNVTKQFPSKLVIQVIEEQPIAYLLNEDGVWLPILENGYIFNGNSEKNFLDRPLVTKWDDVNKIPKLVEELGKIKPSILVEISEIWQSRDLNATFDSSRLIIFTREGYRVHVLLEELGDKMNLYPAIINNLKTKTTKLGDIYLLESMRFEEFDDDNN
ncbi:hypothetical protein BHF71_08580 [Vulcanibacillus modesticaldus]|uniref:POTRA domain-containing protein n=1 Tax=Vulcanibacillus modesticaldus TaxID=337097 RepID=A0A1D2YV01_9BACI|nr:FtsQ-type POTRA domain-containing protein [Vulcanibacillus modesticaldus]OEF99529.1 hypothetical protein BHF71_08580 [Vulcanibacillus modesticaldus]